MTAFAIVVLVTVVSHFDVSSAAFVAFALPALVWAWGRAVEQLAIGYERLDDVVRRRRHRDRCGDP